MKRCAKIHMRLRVVDVSLLPSEWEEFTRQTVSGYTAYIRGLRCLQRFYLHVS